MLPAAIIVIVTFATVLAVQGETRFKAPFMPYVFVLAASSLRLGRKESFEF